MYRRVISSVVSSTRKAISLQACSRPVAVSQVRSYSSKQRDWEAYFNSPEINQWGLRDGLGKMYDYDVVSEPKIMVAALKACQRLDDANMILRFLDLIRFKTGGMEYAYRSMIQELRPTLDEMGITLPEELGLDQARKDKGYVGKLVPVYKMT